MSVRDQLRWTVGRAVLARSGTPARLLRAGAPWRWPWRGARLAVARDNGLGDVLMATPLLREAKRRRPGLHTVLHTTRFAALVRGLPYIDEVLPFEARPAEAIYLRYEDAIPPVAPLAQILADCAGLRLHDMVPDCVVQPALAARWRDAWAGLKRPHIVALRRASRWTANKDWPEANWAALLARLGSRATIIEIGEADATSATAAPPVAALPVAAPGGVDLRGRTTLAELAAAVAAADLYLGPPSGPMHIAAAVGTPGVVIVGGYEHPRGYAYPALRTLYTPLACAPCWLQGPCPHQRACLAAISVGDVEAAVWRTLRPQAGLPAPAG
jgi:ADP-heptose:LPS heptosyltransferase